MPTIAVYAAVLTLLFIALSIRVVVIRGKLGLAIGDGGNAAMLRAMRVHANFAEYVPLGLLLVWLIEVSGFPGWMIHALGGSLLLGRLLHAFGVSREPEVLGYRVAGMALTFTVLGVSASLILYSALSRSLI